MKKRINIIKEGVEYPFAYIEPGALRFPDKPISVSVPNGLGVLGIARDFKRDDENNISAEIELSDGYSELEEILQTYDEVDEQDRLYMFSIFVNELTAERYDSSISYYTQHVFDGLLRGLALVPVNPRYPALFGNEVNN